jgi:hypothetical protein
MVINSMIAADDKGVGTLKILTTLDLVEPEVSSVARELAGAGLRSFTGRFVADIASARAAWTSTPAVATRTLVDHFDFENYPGVKDFAAAASRDPGCVDVP